MTQVGVESEPKSTLLGSAVLMELKTLLSLKVVPGASASEISGWLGATLKVRIAAPPEKGKANTAVIKLLAKALDISPGRVSIVSGLASPRKTVAIHGLTQAQVAIQIKKETSG